MKKLDLSKYETNEDIVDAIIDRVSATSFNVLLEEVNKHFVFQEKATRAIYIGLSMGMNVFLSGPGGYGKSSLVKFILSYFGIPAHTIVGYKDMPVDALLGIPNMQKLIQDSEYQLDFSKCIFGKRGVVIGEEFTDILPSTAAALKDVLTEKGLRLGENLENSYISNMIICANKSSADMSADPSKKALYDERFPVKAEVVWEVHSTDRYNKLLNLKFKNGDKRSLFFLAKLFEENSLKHNNIITPRKALDITKVFLKKGIRFIENFEINLESVNLIQTRATIEYNRETREESLNSIIADIQNIPVDDVSYALNILYALHRIDTISMDDEIVDIVEEVKKKLVLLLKEVPANHYQKYLPLMTKFNDFDS